MSGIACGFPKCDNQSHIKTLLQQITYSYNIQRSRTKKPARLLKPSFSHNLNNQGQETYSTSHLFFIHNLFGVHGKAFVQFTLLYLRWVSSKRISPENGVMEKCTMHRLSSTCSMKMSKSQTKAQIKGISILPSIPLLPQNT